VPLACYDDSKRDAGRIYSRDPHVA
jgi:hypothetical protein